MPSLYSFQPNDIKSYEIEFKWLWTAIIRMEFFTNGISNENLAYMVSSSSVKQSNKSQRIEGER